MADRSCQSQVFGPEEPARSLAEEDRRQAALLEKAFRADPGALALLAGPDLRFLFANDAYLKLLRHDVDPVGRAFAEVWPDDAMRGVEERLRNVLLAHEPVAVEREERVCRDGQRRLFTSHACPLSWEGENAVLCVLWETTALEDARRDAERYAEQAQARAAELEAIIEGIPSGLALYDADGRIMAVNPVAEKLLRMRPGERELSVAERWGAFLVERADGTRLTPDGLPVARALRGEVVLGFEIRIRRADEPEQRPAWVSASAAPIRGRGGTRGAVATYTDVSRLHELQEEREDLIRMVSHDLRTPLTVILTHAHLLAREANDPEVRRRVEAISTSGRRMAEMIHELAEVVRLEAGQMTFARRPVRMADAVRELVERLRGSLAVERVRIHGDAPPVWVDPAALERVLVNLVTNALKYSPESETVGVHIESGGGLVALSVTDRGRGIAPGDQKRIFERFYRARGTRSEGLGLGLYISRMLVEQMGGRIRVASAPGRGSVFTVMLPAAPEHAAEAPAAR